MPIDETQTVVNNEAQTTAPDSGAAEPAQADSSTSSTSQPVGASADAGAPAASQTDDGSGSLTTDEAQSQKTNSDLATYEKRFKDSQRAYQLEHQAKIELERKIQQYEQHLRQVQEQFGGVDPNDLKQYRERTAAPIWSKKHPEHSKFQGYLQRSRFINETLKRIQDPTKRAEVSDVMWEGFPADGIQVLQQYQDHLQSMQQEMLADPDSFFEEKFKKHFEPAIGQWQGNVAQTYEQQVDADRKVNEWFKAEPAIWKGKEEFIKERLNKGDSWQSVQLQLERDYYRNQASSASAAKQSAEEKERLLRGNASTTVARDPQSLSKVDPLKVAKERGIDPGSREFIDLVYELSKSNSL